ncbi:hypothetical protein bpr_III081 [Butyrivibrio proteoclasticus B316]|uniref:Uncharacterized protein n=1 Tax=Butyrivibrio proteoclasticus (strain ATCC 51982 / DSM 14932 / B316) TaxID=515622 RepID=E0S2Y7_BUTPB|nr:hypothetical protein bpr_III081 [Butyrivibrio proteoclasticus B316]
MIKNGAYRAGEDEEHFFMRIRKTSPKQMQLIPHLKSMKRMKERTINRKIKRI